MKSIYRHFLSLSTFLGALLFCMLFFLSHKNPEDVEMSFQKITLKNKEGKTCLVLDATSGAGVVSFFSPTGVETMQITGGVKPSIVMKDKTQVAFEITLADESKPILSLKDSKGVSRMQLQGGDTPALFLKNPQNEIIGTMLSLSDGGAALGLADKEGDVATFVRGGSTPSISFFQKSAEPSAALGISKGVPHLLVYSASTKDNLVLHGGEPTSLLFVEEGGDIPVLLSKHGLFQGKKSDKSDKQSNQPKDEKIFTWDDLLDTAKDFKLN